jgi:hypothetical protein
MLKKIMLGWVRLTGQFVHAKPYITYYMDLLMNNQHSSQNIIDNKLYP